MLDRAFRPAPAVTIHDGHPHTLSFLGLVTGRPLAGLGVSTFGQAEALADICRHHQFDARSIVATAPALL